VGLREEGNARWSSRLDRLGLLSRITPQGCR
jgi:hypothetical protein